MDIENDTPLAEGQSAPESEVTATADIPESTPEVEQKTFTQEELDAAITKRLAREQRKWERQISEKLNVAQPIDHQSSETPLSSEVVSQDVVLQKARELLAHQEQAKIISSYESREDDARDKYDDYDLVTRNNNLPITNVMADAIRLSDIGPDIAYYLGTNVKDADRIAKLPPLAQAKEIGKIEAKLANDPPVKRTTSAPAPISTVSARSSGNVAYDTTDPRSIKTMTTSEWINAERARQLKKLQNGRI